MSEKAKIRDRIAVLKQKLSIASNRGLEKGRYMGEEYVISNGLLATWLDKDVEWTSNDLETFLQYWKVNKEWWKTGEGEVFITSVPKPSDNTDMNKEDLYKDLVEGSSDYSLIPKTVLNGEYRMMLKSEIDSKEKMLWQVIEAKNYAIAQLEKEIAELRAGTRVPHTQNA